MRSTVGYAVREHVAIIRIQRPEVRNALDRAALAALVEAVDRANNDDDVRALVVTGGPDAFCSGEDLLEVTALSAEQFAEQIRDFQRLATALRDSPKPVVAAIAGPAAGGGIEIAVNCDARIAATNATMLCPELTWGLTITNGASVLLRRIVGESWAREMVLFGRVVDARTALQIGLVTRLVAPAELEQEAWKMARAAADHSVEATRWTKALLNADPRTWQDTLAAESQAVTAGFTSDDVQRRLAGFRQRRTS
jgi:enoyl-CoA hydratase/carnithine racemase